MKVRNGFVSNSSSSSFIIALTAVTATQVEQIKNHIEEGRKLGIEFCSDGDAWNIEVTDTHIRGWTSMDNFDMEEFFKKIGVGQVCPHCNHGLGVVDWDEGHFWSSPFDDADDD